MNSRILGEANVALPQAEVDAMLQFVGDNVDYSEFHFGDWKTFVIWNQSGEDNDGMVHERGLPGGPTSRADALPSLIEWIRATFDTLVLKLGRIHSLGDGVLIPHRDFVEFGSGGLPWTRVHVPLLTNDMCLHSEEDTVFRMRAGEIWFLDASNLHSAINLSTSRRLNLCLDFALEGRDVQSIFRRFDISKSARLPDIVARAAPEQSFNEELLSLAATLSEENFRDAVGRLAKVHFFSDVHINQFFEWLELVAKHSQNGALKDKATRYCRFLRTKRSMGERFNIGT